MKQNEIKRGAVGYNAPPIVLLDEARTALDPENESFIQAAISELMKK